jgi:hypothetical protein
MRIGAVGAGVPCRVQGVEHGQHADGAERLDQRDDAAFALAHLRGEHPQVLRGCVGLAHWSTSGP